MPEANDFAVAFLLGCIFFGGMACASGLWGLHCRTVRKRIAELEDARYRAAEEILPLAQTAAENLEGYRKEVEALGVELETVKECANIKAVSLCQVKSALADRIDALSARLDAVELACGLREKPKTMGGSE